MAAQHAQFCISVHSQWIRMAILMCDDTLAVFFTDGKCINYRGAQDMLPC